ncbi:hypothetical protein NLJ89_g5428 [Agrocybe chaxingu]|uniref:Aminoglycoside phosphotransferase domain-containing protein n=1 Tax=Agrocybe chaxingu TaxID=84603 RepID=A0A9W8MVL7_9AGAR|nr:hypothetical protein NLJ89_g5428 [Agrocybe chaxingu]
MEFIARNTTIPVPRVLDFFEVNGQPHLVQEYIEGRILEDVWPKLTVEQRTDAVLQLKGYLDQLRSLPPPEFGRVQAVDGGTLSDGRIDLSRAWGPFGSHEEFGDFSFRGHVKRNLDKYPGAAELYGKVEGRKWKTVFAHGDLGPHNVIWKDGRIVAIIDWEFAGWFPEYWEYTRTFLVTGLFPQDENRCSFWKAFDSVVDRYPDELAIEQLLAANFDGFYL